jgi:hypothetical protein
MPIGMPWMAGFGGFHRVDRQSADGVGHDPVFGQRARQYLRLPGQRRLIARNIRQTRHVLLFRFVRGVHNASRPLAQTGVE